MSTTTEHEDGEVVPLRSNQKPGTNGFTSLTAAARRLTTKLVERIGNRGILSKQDDLGWEQDAWDTYDLVGEQRFLANAIAGRMAQARIYVGKVPDDPTQPPVPLAVQLPPGDTPPEGYEPPSETDLKAAAAWAAFGDTPQGKARLIERMGQSQFMVGKGWFVGIPKDIIDTGSPSEQNLDRGRNIIPTPDASSVDVNDLVWRMLSVSEVKNLEDGYVDLYLDSKIPRQFNLNHIYLIKIWRSHPRWSWQSDSPVRSSLPVLRELIGLTMHISAQIDSRLAGAGIFLIPQGAKDALMRQTGNQATGDSNDPFVEAVMDAAGTAIENRSSAEALMPIMVTVPGEEIANFRFITFATPLDAEARPLREESIRRVALGEDAPPDLLLSSGSLNHWGEWLQQEDTIRNHVVPPLNLILDGLTTEYLWEVLEQQKVPEAEAQRYVILADVEHLIVRPNKSQDAKDAHTAGVISDESYRDAVGFTDDDAPDDSVQSAEEIAFEMVRTTPALAKIPGLPSLVEQIRAVLEGTAPPPLPVEKPSQVPIPGTPAAPIAGEPAGIVPDTAGQPAAPPAITASGNIETVDLLADGDWPLMHDSGEYLGETE